MTESIRTRQVMFVLAGLFLVGVVFTTGIAIAQRTAGISDEARTLVGSEGVVHILAQQSIDGSAAATSYEAWVDAANDRAKYVTHDGDRNPIIEIIVDGAERTVYNFRDDVGTKRIGTDANDPILRSIMVDLWYIGAMYRLGQAEELDAIDVDGIDTVRVQANISGPASRVVASLDSKSLLPLEEEYYDDGGSLIASRSTRYSLVETLDEAAPGLFVSSAGSDRLYEVRTRMTLSQAQEFQGFDIYYVGETLGDRRVFWIQHDKRSSVYPQQGLLNAVLIHYTTGGTAPGHRTESTTFVRTERATLEDISAWEAKGRQIHNGVVRQIDENDFRLELLRGEVLVTLRTSSQADLEIMRGQVVKLN